MNSYDSTQYKKSNTIKVIILIICIVMVGSVYVFLPSYDMKKTEKAYTQVIDKLCGKAVEYSTNKEIQRRNPGDTIYVRLSEMQKDYLIGADDLIDPRNNKANSQLPVSSYIRLSMTSSGEYFCEGLINNVNDVTPPTINLNGSDTIIISKGTNLNDPGAKSTDDVDGDVTPSVTRSGNVDVDKVGEYTINYSSSDMAGNVSVVERKVKVVEYKDLKETKAKNIDRIQPTIEIKGNNPYCLERNKKYEEPGVVAKDNVDGNISEKVIVDQKINENISNNYRVTYTVSDTAGNITTAYRSVIVKENCNPVVIEPKKEEVIPNKKEEKEEVIPDKKEDIQSGSIVEEEKEEVIPEPEKPKRVNTKPKITLQGDTSITIEFGSKYSDIGAIASDTEDGDLTHKIKIDSSGVNVNKGGIYYVSYEVEDSGGLVGKAERIVNVKSETIESNVAKFNKTPQDLKIKLGYVEEIEKLTATDSRGKSLAVKSNIYNSSGEEVSSIDYYKAGKYKIKYSAVPEGGVIQTVERLVEIYDDEPPVLLAPLTIKIEVLNKSCNVTESFLTEKGVVFSDGNNEIKPKLVIEGNTNILCSQNNNGSIIKAYAVDSANNKSEIKEIKIVVLEKAVEKPATVAVTNIEIMECKTGSMVMEQSKSFQFNAVLYPIESTEKGITWSSSNSDIVSVSPLGKIQTSINIGKAIIIAKSSSGSKVDECVITVTKPVENKPPVISVSSVDIGGCDGGKLTLEKGNKQILSSNVKPDNATNKNILWSSNTSSISVLQNGEITAKSAGSATVILKSEDGNKSSTCNVTVVEKKVVIEIIEPLKPTVISNNANINDPYNKSGNWLGGTGKKEIRLVIESIDKVSKIAKFEIVNNKGTIIKEVSPLLNNNSRGEIIWNQDINEALRIRAVNVNGLSSPLSDPIQMNLDNTGPKIKFVKWISNPNDWVKEKSIKVSYEAIDSLSKVARFEYTHDDVKAKPDKEIVANKTASTELVFNESNINSYVYVRAVDSLGNIGPWTQNPSYLNMDTIPPQAPVLSFLDNSNNTPNVKIAFSFKDNKNSITKKESGFGKFEYKINTGIIQVLSKEKDTVSITTPGTYKLEAWSFDKAGNKSTSTIRNNINVIPNKVMASSITLNIDNISLKKDETYSLVGTVSPSNTTDKTIEWTTSNPNIAIVNSLGVVKGISSGTAVITAKINGKSATTKVSVSIVASSLSLNKTSSTLLVNKEETFIATITPNDTTNKTVIWTSSDTNVAKVNNNGVVKAINTGSSIISASIDGKTAKATVIVKSEEIGPIIPAGKPNLVSESDTLKYYRITKNNVYLTYIWMKNPYEQVKKIEANVAKYGKVYTDEELSAAGLKPTRTTVKNMLDAYTSSGKIPSNKSFVAFNGSGFYVSGSWEPPQPYYHNRSSSWFSIIDGKVIRNRYDDAPLPSSTIIGIDTNNNLKLFKHIKNSQERYLTSQKILELGIKNTFDFNPIVLYEGVFNEALKERSDTAHRQMICQLNSNNFIMLTTINKKTIYDAGKLLESLGCITIMNLDGGGSTQLYYKKVGSKSITKSVCRDGPQNSDTICRSIVEGIYFVEQ